MLKTGIVGTSLKEDERRVPIHPNHLPLIPHELQKHIIIEQGYGLPFGISDSEIAKYIPHQASRTEIINTCDVVILPKPVIEDLLIMKEGAIFWGWAHCVQQREITQAAIDKRLTIIAFEAMFNWRDKIHKDIHIFCKNNELAGYCGVFHALQILGADGHYGPPRKAVILSFGSVSRGAAYALCGRGFNDITIYTQRPPYLVQNQLFGYKYGQMQSPKAVELGMTAMRPEGTVSPLVDVLAEADIIVNGILQDTDAPVMYLNEHEIPRLKRGCLIIDISCDSGMGFPFARSTTFETPTFQVGDITYYAVDHTPSYLWNSASWNISEALLPYLPVVISGPSAWAQELCIERAIEIRAGVIQNPKILSFQNR